MPSSFGGKDVRLNCYLAQGDNSDPCSRERFKNKSEIKAVRAVGVLAGFNVPASTRSGRLAQSGRIDPHPESLGGYGRAILQAGL
jgi:hypothetical protein